MNTTKTATDGKKQTYGMGKDWANIDLSSPSESASNMLDAYSFDTLLLEISCNLRDINKETVRAQAMESIRSKYNTAIEILNDNLENITKHAQKERVKP
jgi:hypothetical protein